MNKHKKFQYSRQLYRQNYPCCKQYQKGLAGFCLNCHKLKWEHQTPIYYKYRHILNPILKQQSLRYQLQRELKLRPTNQQYLKEWVMI